MKLLASKPVQGRSGTAYVEIYDGDLTNIPVSFDLDCLVVSAFPDDYKETPDSVIGGLARKGLRTGIVAALRKEVDLRTQSSCWLSRELNVPGLNVRRLMCFETHPDLLPAERVCDVFTSLMQIAVGGLWLRRVAMPLLAAGDMNVSRPQMLRGILNTGISAIEAGLPLERLQMVLHGNLEELEEILSAVRTIEDPARVLPPSDPSSKPSTAISQGYDVFISYCRANQDEQAAVDLFVGELKRRNPELRVFRDTVSLQPGVDWLPEIQRAVADCRLFIPFLSPAYAQSRMCNYEWNLAYQRKLFTSPTLLYPICLNPTGLPIHYSSVQYVECKKENAEQLPRIVTDVLNRLRGST